MMTDTPLFDATKSKTENENPLTAKDRCDACRAQAYVKVYFTEASDLMFCGHHWTKYRKKIGETYTVFDVIDETASINVARDKE